MEFPPQRRFRAVTLWVLCVAVVLGPAMLVWLLRLLGLALGCAAGPAPCRALALGSLLQVALDAAWMIGLHGALLMGLSILAALFAFQAKKPMLGTLTLLVLPVLALVLPILAVFFSRYEGCLEAGSACVLWGTAMGDSFQNSATAHEMLFSLVPWAFALAVMGGIAGFFLTRPQPRRL